MDNVIEFFHNPALWQRLGLLTGFIILGFAIFFTMKTPRQDRDWIESLSLAPQATRKGEIIELSQIRNWRWNEDGPTAKNYDTIKINPNEISAVWFLLEPFEGSSWVGHTYLVFELKDKRLLGLSVEARRQNGQKYSAIKGVFKTYELIYLWGWADDLFSQRALNLDHEQFIWRLDLDAAERAALFDRVINVTENLQSTPRFYNTLFNNCTNELAQSAGLDWGWAHILTARSAPYLEKRGFLPEGASITQVDISNHLEDRLRQGEPVNGDVLRAILQKN